MYGGLEREREREREKVRDRDIVAIVCAKCVCGVCVERDRKIERGRASQNVCTCVLLYLCMRVFVCLRLCA